MKDLEARKAEREARRQRETNSKESTHPADAVSRYLAIAAYAQLHDRTADVARSEPEATQRLDH